jgi:hypothetical protein
MKELKNKPASGVLGINFLHNYICLKDDNHNLNSLNKSGSIANEKIIFNINNP